MRRLSSIKTTIDTWRGLEKRTQEALDLFDLADAEGDQEILDHVDEEAAAIAKQLDTLEHELAFNGPYDYRNAILAVHAGAGGTESQDWAQMLLRMYLRWAESHGFGAEVVGRDARRGGRHQERDPGRCRGQTLTAGCEASAAYTGWCASRLSTPRTRVTRLSRWWR